MNEEIKQQVLEFLKFNGYSKTAQKLLVEKPVINENKTSDSEKKQPRLVSYFDGASVKEGRRKRVQNELAAIKI